MIDCRLELQEEKQVQCRALKVDLPDDIGFSLAELFGDETLVDALKGVEIKTTYEPLVNEGLEKSLDEQRMGEKILVANIMLASHREIIPENGGIGQA